MYRSGFGRLLSPPLPQACRAVTNASNRRWLILALCLPGIAASGCATTQTQEKAATPAAPTSVQAGTTTVVAVAPPAQECCPKQTLIDFLGITQVVKGAGGLSKKVGTRIRSRLGTRFPGLEPKPPLLTITDPANLGEDVSPAVKAAAEVKAQEDEAAQKIKALRYLARIGCGGCYPTVEDALLAALDDCTEEVRFEAVSGLRSTSGDPCTFCKSSSCCSPKVLKKLDEIANKMDDQGCYEEPSERVRRVARLALAGCGGAVPFESVPQEGPTEAPPPEAPPTSTALSSALAAAKVIQGSPISAKRMADPAVSFAVQPKASDGSVVQNVAYLGADRDVLRAYYEAHQDRYWASPEVSWERISLPADRFTSREHAREVIDYLRSQALGMPSPVRPQFDGNKVISEVHNSMPLSALSSPLLAQTLTALPVGRLSPVLEDASGWHLVRVLARKPARPLAFDEALPQVQRDLERIADSEPEAIRAVASPEQATPGSRSELRRLPNPVQEG